MKVFHLRKAAISFGLILILGALPISALASSSGHGQKQSKHSGASTYVLRSYTNLVLVDVVVSHRGDPVHGLRQKDFHISDNGHPYAIVYFNEHTPAESYSPASPAQQTPLPPHTYTNATHVAKSSAVDILLLDALNTPMSDQFVMRQQALQYLRQHPPGAPTAVFTLGSRLRMLHGFTTNTSELEHALQSPQAVALPAIALKSGEDQIFNMGLINGIGGKSGGATLPGGNNGPAGMADGAPDADTQRFLNQVMQSQANMKAGRMDMRVEITIVAMQQLARYLAAIPGRKNLIWLSDSFPLSLAPIAQDTPQDVFSAMRNYSRQVAQTSSLLNAAHVAVYPVYAAGVQPPSLSDAAHKAPIHLAEAKSPSGLGFTNAVTDDDESMERAIQAQGSMKQIARQTGGHAFLNTNDIASSIAKAVRNGSSYYTIGYSPQIKQYNGLFHKIRVRLNNKDYQLAYRHGYYSYPLTQSDGHDLGDVNPINAALAPGAPPSTQILFRARILAANDPHLKGQALPTGSGGNLSSKLKGPTHRVVIDLEISPQDLSYKKNPDGRRSTALGYTLVAYSPQGRRLNYVTGTFRLDLTPGQFNWIQENGVSLRTAIQLPAQKSILRIAVYDPTTGRVGSLQIPVVK